MKPQRFIFWLSWFQPTADPRPLWFPPNEAILGYWVSAQVDGGSNLVAAVLADGETDAKGKVRRDWPEAKFHFAERRNLDWRPSRRFKFSPWTAERFRALESEVTL